MAEQTASVEREVAFEDLFFSTTDRKGVIEGSNTVFCHYARYSMDELLGAPHNIIRHPDMPGGVFHIMWDLLLSGRPMAGYVANLAADGATYWVFATITPLGDGFLSVRQRPCVTDTFRTATALYEQVRPAELEARREGAGRAQAAHAGAQTIQEAIVGLGFADYPDFIRHAVPAEVAARRAVTSWTAADPRDPVDGVTRALVDAAVSVDRALDTQEAALSELETLSAALDEASSRSVGSVRQLDSAVTSATAASQEVHETEPVLATVARPVAETSGWLRGAFDELARLLARARRGISELQLNNALARLHDETLAEFAREMAAGEAPERAPVYVQQLCRALEETATTVTQETAMTRAVLDDVADALTEVREKMLEFQRHLATWRLLIPRYGLSRQLDPYTGPIDGQLNAGMTLIGQVHEVAQQCVTSARRLDAEPLARAVRAVVAAREAAVHAA